MTEKRAGTSYRIADLEESERPRERLKSQGAAALSKAELLAILLRVGVQGENAVALGQRLLDKFHGLDGIHRAPFEELMNEHGIGEAKAAQIKAAIELGRRLSIQEAEEPPTIDTPQKAAAEAYKRLGYAMSAMEEEHLAVILLDTRNHVLDTVEIYKGSVNTAQVRTADVFKAAIRRNATALIVVHNHPSGDPTPSPDDVAVTRELVKAGELIDVKVLDHVIIGQGKDHFVSMKERGLGFA